MKIQALVLAMLAHGCASTPVPAAPQVSARTPVYVVGTLYRRHASVTAYGLDPLRAVVRAIGAKVWVLDVTPSELTAERVHASKIEYPGVVFPLLHETGARAYAAEPGEPMFTEIVQATVRDLEAFKAERPAQAAALQQLQDGAYAALEAWWSSPAEVNSEATDRVLAGLHAMSSRVAGAANASGWLRWNQHTAEVVQRAAGAHRGEPILVLTGIENRYAVIEHLRGDPALEVVAMEAWIRDHVAAAPAGSR